VAKGFAGAEDQTHASILSVRKLLSAPVEKPEGRTKHIAPTETGPPLYLTLQTLVKICPAPSSSAPTVQPMAALGIDEMMSLDSTY